nr:MAG: putative glycoprotein [Xinmoviridae sp. 2]
MAKDNFKICLLILTIKIANVLSIYGFDCASNEVEKTTISLINTLDCKVPEKNLEISTVKIQLFQDKHYKEIDYIQCSITMKHLISRCGKTYDQFVDGGLYSEILDLSKEECSSIIRTRSFFYSNVKFDKLQINQNNKFSFTSHGRMDGSGTCIPGSTLYINGKNYDRPIRQTDLNILFRRGKGSLNLESKEVILENGFRCEYLKYECLDINFGMTFWSTNLNDRVCNEGKEYTVLYQGESQKIVDTTNNNNLTYFTVPLQGLDYTIMTISEKKICNLISYTTEQPKIYIVEENPHIDFTLKYSPDIYVKEIKLVSYMNSKISYIMHHTKQEVDRIASELLKLRCETERKAIMNSLALARISPVLFAYNYFKAPGYTAIVSGEVIHITKCKPIYVQIVKMDMCFLELPVIYNNKTGFLTPQSKIFTNLGTATECNNILPNMFNLDGRWYTSNLNGLTEILAPIVLDPNYNKQLEFTDIKDLAKRGLYSLDDLDKLSDALMSPIQQKAIDVSLMRTLKGTGNLPEGYSLMNGFSPDQIVDIAGERFSERMGFWYAWCYKTGGILSFIAFMTIVIKFVLGTCSAGGTCMHLYKTFGCTMYLVSGICDGLAHMFIVRKGGREETKSTRDEMEEIQYAREIV